MLMSLYITFNVWFVSFSTGSLFIVLKDWFKQWDYLCKMDSISFIIIE